MIKLISEKQAYFQTKGSTLSRNEFFELMACTSAQNLSITFKNHEVVFLPVLHREFIHMACPQSVSFPNVGVVTPDDVPGTRWLLLFYSFLHLVGCAYFKVHSSAFHQQSPETLFHSVGTTVSVYRETA